MDDDKFWTIIHECNAASAGDMDKKEGLIKTAISRLPADDALSFYNIFNRFMDIAFTWSLWGAAYVVNGGCGDDSFMDFRASLISRGRAIFEKSIADTDSLADETIDIDRWFHEGFQYAISNGVKANIGHPPKRVNPPPSSPSGQQWLEATVRDLYPRLAQKVSQSQ